MKNIKNEYTAENLSSTFGNFSITDDLGDVMKLSILMKCHQIHKGVHNVTLGPTSTGRATPIAKKALWNNTKSNISLKPANNIPENNKSDSECLDRPQIRSTRDERNIIHMKALSDLESRRRQDLNASIEIRRQKFIDFERKQREEEKKSWQAKQEMMIKLMQQQEMQIKKILEEHAKEIEDRNKKIENHYKQLVEKRIKEEQDIDESKKQIKSLVDGISKHQCEFTAIYNDVVEDIRKMSTSSRGGFTAHISTLDQLSQQLEAIVENCKTPSLTVQQKDLARCSEIIELASKLRKQVHDIPKVDRIDVKEKPSPFKLQVPQTQILNELPSPIEPPPYQPPRTAPIVRPPVGFPPSATAVQHAAPSIFPQNTNQQQAVVKSPPPIVSEPPSQESKAAPKLEKYVNKSLLERYVHLQNLLMQKDQISKQIIENPSLKTFKNNCKKAVNIPVNTLTDATPQHLLDKYIKLNNVLNGKTVEISGDHINVGQHPQGVDFCMDLLAKKFVLQGDLIVSSNTAISAFNYASVILSLWNDFPMFGDLLLGHFYRECPYLLPFYPPQVPGQTEDEFAKTQGYRLSKGELEGQDIFLKRMVGFMRLYAATLVASPKQSHKGVSRQSMSVAWQWLASTLNLQPRADITAAMIHTFLETVGFKMQQVFGKQFHKLIMFLSTEYIPKIRAIDTEGPVNRLELILQEYAKDGSFPEPEGMLPSNFW